ncbi:MAG: TRAP transporter small permease subunit [Clostridia bacterium]|nr:TRAP transporter small permease subunit [Clostridia bacterium]
MKKIISAILLVQEALGAILLALFFSTILLQIGARYAKLPLLWTEEVANYSFIWAVFMGASAMVYHRAHFSFSFFSERFKGKKGAYHSLMISALVLCFTIPMSLYGISIVDTFWDYNWITLPWMRMGVTWLCLPIMGFSMTLYTVYHMVCDWRRAQAPEGGQ